MLHKTSNDKTGCSNYRRISNILVSRLSLYVDKIIGDHK
jgi:hypothetical protein